MTVGLKFRHFTDLLTNQSKAALNKECPTALLLVEKLEEDLGAVECLKNLIIRQKILDSGTL